MPVYVYKAINVKGRSVKGSIDALSELDASTKIAKLGYTPVSIGLKIDKSASFLSRIFKKKVKKASAKSLIVFTRQFAVIVKAAVPVVEGLGVLAEQSESASLKDALHKIVRDVEEGQKLSEAMSRHPAVFSELYVNTVLAGESGGVLDKVLMRLADVMEEQKDILDSLKSAMRYPVMVVIALIVAVFILSVLVIPQFAKVYASFKASLPLPTQIMILIGKLTKDYWFVTFPILIGLFKLAKFIINTPRGRLWWDGLKFKIVVFGVIYNKIVMLRFSSMLNVLYQAGLPILKILDIVKITIGNVVLAQEIDKVRKEVSDGKGISGGVLSSKLFPRLVGYMISIGEKTGSLPLMLDSLCDYFTMEVRVAMRNFAALIEPLMTLVLGVVVAFMALSIFLPMWNLMQAVKSS